MDFTPIKDSSCLAAAGYDEQTKTLRVRFRSGHEVDYQDIALEDYEGLLKAKSKGKYFHARIRKASK